MRVLVIPEDPTHDQYILKPVVERIFEDLGRAARVDVLQDPHLAGVAQALDASSVHEIVEDNPMVDLFLLIVDRDCDRLGNTAKAEARTREHRGRLLACLAIEEVEVWMLALHRDALSVHWSVVRTDCDPKESFADPFLDENGREGVGQGRKRAMAALRRGWRGLLQVCPEITELKGRIADALAAPAP